ncbi:10343_t:CDS:2, partial [Dentiscutata erythropus]
QKNLIKIMDHIKKDLQKVADDDSEFEMTRKRKAREILDNWKKWSTQKKNLKRSNGVNIGSLQVKKIKQFAGNHANQIMGNNITLGTKKDDHEELRKTPEHKIYSDSFVPPTRRSESDDKETDSDAFSPDKRNPKNFTFDEFVDGNDEYVDDDQESLFLDEFFLDDSVALDDGNPSLSHILLLQADNFSDLQIEQFSGDTLVDFRKHMRNIYIIKNKVAQSVKAIFRECIEIALDEDLGPKEAEKTLEQLFTKSFDDPIDQKKFERMRFVFLQLMSAKVRKLANLDSSRAKQPDMIGNVVNNNKSKYEMMFGEITGEGKNNNIKKNNMDLIRLGIFMKDALDILIKKTGKNHMTFAWQTIVVTVWTGYIMEKYEYEVQRFRDDIRKKKEDTHSSAEISSHFATSSSNSEDKIVEKVKSLPDTKTKFSISTESHVSNSSGSKLSQENNPEIKVNVSFNPTHTHAYFCNKILD